jgi:pimeloyl-ACP methyl ester carboxylesterase
MPMRLISTLLLACAACAPARQPLPPTSAMNAAECGAPRIDPGERWTDPSPHRCAFVAVNGIRLQYLDWGGAGEPVVLLHGSGSTAHSFDDLAPRLTDRFRVLGLTRRGHGHSDHPADGYTIAQTTADVLAFLDALGIRRAHLVAHSLAGAEITRLARLHPGRVASLTYLDAIPDWAGETALPDAPVARPTPAAGFGSMAERVEWLRRYFYRFWTPALEADLRYGRPNRDAVNALDEDAVPVAPDYGEIIAPVLAIHTTRSIRTRFPWLLEPGAAPAERDAAQAWLDTHHNPNARAVVERFSEQLPHARVVVIEGHHYVHNSNLDQVAAEMRLFLDLAMQVRRPETSPRPGQK